MTTQSTHWQHQFIQTNQIRLHYVTQGEGELVVLLHGFAEFWYSWRYQLPTLARHFKVVIPDLRGYNDSDKPESGYDIDTLSADIVGLIQNLGYQCAHVVGHDCGGMIAWNLAQKFPQYLQNLVLLNAPPPQRLVQEFASTLDQWRRNWYLLALQIPGLPEQLLQLNLQQFLRDWFQKQAIRKAPFSNETMQIYQAALEKTGVLSAVSHYYRQLMSPQSWLPKLDRPSLPIQVPTLVLWGEDDTVLSPSLAQGLDQLIQAPFRLKLVPDCGHWIQQEVPRVVNRELLDFFRKEPSFQLVTGD